MARLSIALVVLLVPSIAHAWPQPRDYFLDPPRPGTFVHGDLFTAGAQVSLEHRAAIEDPSMGMFHARASALGSLGYGEVAGHLDVRVLGLLGFGASAGYRRVWNSYSQPNDADSREDRHDKIDRGPSAIGFPWFEARSRLVIPLERLWLVANGALRWESPGGGAMPDNTFDWFHTDVHDPGRLFRLDATLFVRHESFGAIGPTVRFMDLPKDGTRKRELVYGFTFGTRPGFKKRDDMFLVQTLVDLADKGKEFGWHVGPLAKIPLYVMLIYRGSFQL